MSQTQSAATNGSASPAYLVVMVSAVALFNATDRVIFSVALEPIKTQFGFSDSQMGLLGGFAFAMFYAVVALPIARLAKIYPRRSLVALCLALWSLATTLTSLAQGFASLFLARLLVGVGEAGGGPLSLSLLAGRFAPDRRAAPIAIYTTTAYCGFALGLGGTGALIGHLGWRGAFLVLGAPGIALAALFWRSVAEPAEASDPATSAFADILQLRRNWAYLHVVLFLSSASFIGYATLGWAATFYQRSFNMSPEDSGFFMGIVLGLGAAAGAALAGVISRLGASRAPDFMMRVAFWTSLINIPAGLAAFVVPNRDFSMALLMSTMVLGGISIPPYYAALQSLVRPAMRATATALATTTYIFFGQGLGPLFAGLLSDALQARVGNASLGWSLLIMNALAIWPTYHSYRAMRLYNQAARAVTL